MVDNNKTTSAAMTRSRFNHWNVLPFVVFFAAYMIAPRFAGERQLTMLIYIGISAILAVGLNLLMGYAGQISLGHAAFYGMGAYSSAILTTRPVPSEAIPGLATGIGIIAGCALIISLTRASGLKLAGGVASLVIIALFAGRVHGGFVALVGMYAVAMAAYGLVSRLGWWQCSVSGVVAGVMTWITNSFLAGTLERGGTSPWTGISVGIFVTSVIAYLIGGQILRLKGHYLAMGTLAFGIIVEIVFRQWTTVTGGSSDGIYSIPTIQVLDSIPKSAGKFLQMAGGGPLDDRQQYYYLVWGIVFVALLVACNIVNSRVGRAFRAVHGSESAAESLGVDTGRYKVQVFVLSAALASIAGSMHAHNAGIGYINPSEFNFMVSVQLVVMVVVGGLGSVWGALLGATIIQILKDWLLNLDKLSPEVFGLTLQGLDPIVFGAVLIVVMIVLPQGLARGLTDTVMRVMGRLQKGQHRVES